MLKRAEIMSQKLNLSIKTSLNLTSSLRKSIEILQMPHLDLSQLVRSEIEHNPFLQSDEYEISIQESDRDFDHINTSSNDENYDPMSGIKDTKTSLENIFEQIGQILPENHEKIIANYLLNLLDERGYINLNLEGASADLKCPAKEVEKILYKIQELEPAGIFARNLEECLILQLKSRNKYDSIFKQIISNLELVAKHDLSKLSKICGISLVELHKRISIIRSLNPRPANFDDASSPATKIPDVYLYIDEEDEITVSLNAAALPKVSVNKTFYNHAKKQKLSHQDKDFISNYYYAANNLIRSVAGRSKTILDVARAIAEKQKNFFLKGVMYFEPLTLVDIAKEVAMNESTISRATSGKYISTPTGIYEMKFFFSSNLSTKNSDSIVSSTKVKEIIKTIIETESSGNILSDDAIAIELAKFNIDIARRTVAKYRESMGIETSSVRKRKAKMLANTYCEA